MPVSVARSLVIIAAVAGTIFFTRLCPFLFFPPGKPIPPVIQYLGKVLPPAVIGMLVIYCLKAVSITSYPWITGVYSGGSSDTASCLETKQPA